MVFVANEKYGFAAVVEGRPCSFAPFETVTTATKVRDALANAGASCGEVVPVYTVGTANGMVWALRNGKGVWPEQFVAVTVDPPSPPAMPGPAARERSLAS